MPRGDGLLPAKKTIHGRQDEQTRYLMNVLENSPNIVIYHRAGPSKLQNCSDVDHFHMLIWHSCHPTSQHRFNILKRLLKTRGSHPYNVSVQKVYNPHGLRKYLTEDPSARYVVAADNIKTTGQKHMLHSLTDRRLKTTETLSSDGEILEDRKTTIRGQKYEFIKKLMKNCNSTALGDIMLYYKNTSNVIYRKTWKAIHRNTPNLTNIVGAAATDCHVTLIWEQIRAKTEFFEQQKNTTGQF